MLGWQASTTTLTPLICPHLTGNSQPGIGAAPAPGADEQVGDAGLAQPRIELVDLAGDLRAAGGIEGRRLDVDDVADDLGDPVAQHPVAVAKGGLAQAVVQIHLDQLVLHDQGADLQQAELGGEHVRAVEAHRELGLDRAVHRLAAQPQQVAHDAGQRKDLAFQDVGEIDDARAVEAHPVVDGIVLPRIGGGQVFQDAVLFRLVQAVLDQVLVLLQEGDRGLAAHGDGVKVALGKLEHVLDRGELRQDAGERRGEAQGDAAVDDGLAQAQGDVDHPVLGLGLADGIIIVGAGHAGKVGIEAFRVRPAHHRLDDHGHLFVLHAVGRAGDVGLGLAEERRRIDELDGVDQVEEADIVAVLVVGQHLGGIDAGERLVEGILQQARGADGQGRP